MNADFFVGSKSVTHKPEDNIWTNHHSELLNSCHLIAVAGRRFYHKLFSDSCICYSMAKRWTCFWLEPSALSSVDGVWAMLLPLRSSAIQWRGLFARGLDKTAHSNLQISASKCRKTFLISLSLLLHSPSTSTQTHLHEQAFKILQGNF